MSPAVPEPSQRPVVPRPAATLMLVRDGAAGIEVLMVRRSPQVAFVGGAWVFPGGTVAAEDERAEAAGICCGSERFAPGDDTQPDALRFRICAIRECFEETGLLLARDALGQSVSMTAPGDAQSYAGFRGGLAAGQVDLADLCRSRRLRLAADELEYWSHWITPLGVPKRFDTRFFVARAPEGQQADHDGHEIVDHMWIAPGEALERHRRGGLEIVFATAKTLESIACFDTANALMEYARSPRPITPIQPRLAMGRQGRRVIGPDDHAYDEVGKLDPFGKLSASYEIVPGVVTQLSPLVRRVTAPNANFMTGPGTNSYLVGAGDEVAVIDPGPESEPHVQALLEHTGGRIGWILVTHTHKDHSPAALALQARTGAQLLGLPPPPQDFEDQSFRPQRLPAHGERLELGGCRLRVLHTPGHASNHLCYLLEDEGILFSGDHIMQGSTVVIAPPDGHMGRYMASLRLLLEHDIAYVAPAHGFLMDRPRDVIERLIAHRLDRENKIFNVVCEAGEGTLDSLVAAAYDDVPARIHRIAKRSLLAHLIKLRDEGRVSESGERWGVPGRL